ncbi:MAG TPA: sigma 54-interacting transcriptional regulator, partial [Flavobacterium sp.]|nr:sigma 54-interacting transcriptional regulator [Flavobacterium sp.]
LLSVLQTKSVVRLGESKPRPLNVRIISATNSDIRKEVREKQFREDLFYRINTMEITLPPLRERKGDIVPMAAFLLAEKAMKYEMPALTFAPENLEWLERYPWPGNIREMENKIERAVILSDGSPISVRDLDILDFVPVEEEETETGLSGLERNAIERALAKHGGNVSRTAEELGLSRGALYRRLEKYGINPDLS